MHCGQEWDGNEQVSSILKHWSGECADIKPTLCWGCNKPIGDLRNSHIFGYPKFIAVYHESCCPSELHNLPCLDCQQKNE